MSRHTLLRLPTDSPRLNYTCASRFTPLSAPKRVRDPISIPLARVVERLSCLKSKMKSADSTKLSHPTVLPAKGMSKHMRDEE